MDRHETRHQESAQQPSNSTKRGLLSDTIAGLEAFFPHRHQSSAPPTALEQRAMVASGENDLSEDRGQDPGRQPDAQQQRLGQPGAAARPGQHAGSGRRPLFRS
jgi:hypothetical protein